jgi:hypothetical protein
LKPVEAVVIIVEASPTEAQPRFFSLGLLSDSGGIPTGLIAAGGGTVAVAFDTLIPAAAAILRSSRSSRLRSFSLRLSISSWACGLALACMSLYLALW